MAKQTSISYAKFQEQFSNEDSCREYLFKRRWNGQFICPKCGCTEYYFLSKRHLYQCKNCRHQQSLTAGTVMHRSHLSLMTWFWAIFLIAKDKRGYSAAMLSRELDLPYNTAWFLLHRIRTAMSQRDSQYRLSGIVELDDTYFGKPSKGHKRGRGTAKTKVIVAVSKTTDEKPLKVKMQVVPNLKGTTIGKFVKANIDEQSTIQTDAYHSYRKPLAQKYFHQYEVFSPDSEMLKWLHILIGNAKAFVGGTFHGLGSKHLDRYLHEFCYRFNRRFCNDIFANLCSAVAASFPLPFADLTR